MNESRRPNPHSNKFEWDSEKNEWRKLLEKPSIISTPGLGEGTYTSEGFTDYERILGRVEDTFTTPDHNRLTRTRRFYQPHGRLLNTEIQLSGPTLANKFDKVTLGTVWGSLNLATEPISFHRLGLYSASYNSLGSLEEIEIGISEEAGVSTEFDKNRITTLDSDTTNAIELTPHINSGTTFRSNEKFFTITQENLFTHVRILQFAFIPHEGYNLKEKLHISLPTSINRGAINTILIGGTHEWVTLSSLPISYTEARRT